MFYITGESERGGEKTSQRLESLLQSEDEGGPGLDRVKLHAMCFLLGSFRVS